MMPCTTDEQNQKHELTIADGQMDPVQVRHRSIGISFIITDPRGATQAYMPQSFARPVGSGKHCLGAR